MPMRTLTFSWSLPVAHCWLLLNISVQGIENLLSMTKTGDCGRIKNVHLPDTFSSCHNTEIWIQDPQSLRPRFFSSSLNLISDKEAGLLQMVPQRFAVGTGSVFLQEPWQPGKGNSQHLHTEEISTSDTAKAWWVMKARGAEGHKLVQKRWETLKKVEVGFQVMKGSEELRWQWAKMTRRAWETSGWLYLKLQDENMRGNIRGNITAPGENQPEIPGRGLTPVSLTCLPTPLHLGKLNHEPACTFALCPISSEG